MSMLKANVPMISIHALRGEGDVSTCSSIRPHGTFQSTPSAGRATIARYNNATAAFEISIHALRGEGDFSALRRRPAVDISIHALRWEGDDVRLRRLPVFNPRPPRGGRQTNTEENKRPSRISIHALRGEGDPVILGDLLRIFSISIHALRGEGELEDIL